MRFWEGSKLVIRKDRTSPALTARVAEARIHPELMGSDHCPVSVDIDV